MNIPSKLKIGGTQYTVKVVDVIAENAGIAGRIDHDKELIRLSKGKQSYMEITFLHEIIHAMNNQWSEEFVEFMAISLHQVIKDNPELFKTKEVKQNVRRRKKT